MFESDQEVYSNLNDNKDSLGPDLIQYIKKIIKSEGFIKYSIYVKKVSTEGGNYLSLLNEVDIKGEIINDKKETHLFIKKRLADTDKDVLSPKKLFLYELFIYTELEVLFNELQNKFKVPYDEKYQFVKCYNDDYVDSLIFDNMERKGFTIKNRAEVVPLKTMEVSIQQIAKFHGFSMVLKLYNADFYANKIQTVKHPFDFNEKGNKFIMSLCNISLENLEDDRKIKMEKFFPVLLEKYNNYLNDSKSKIKCLCHGDYRMNNILVKEKNGEATTVIPIDYQLIHYGSPITDLTYLIFLSTDRQFRKDYMEHLKKTYYESFTKFLRYFKIDAESVYSKEDYEDDFKKQLDYGLIASLTILPLVYTSEDDVPELNNEIKEMKLQDKFKLRINEIVDDFIDWGYL